MPKVGIYDILDDLHLTDHGSVSRAARLDGGRGDLVVKRFGMPVDDPSEPHWELQTFLDRARVQQMLAAGGARHWAPVHDLGIDGDWAYYATDYLPLSAQKLIDSRVAVKPAALHALVLGVAKGLSELKALRNRPHGNLKPTNVFIGGRDLASAPILIADPASNGQAAKVGEAGDLRAVGELIHQIVLLRPPTAGQWPLPPAAEWNNKLGAQADQWRRLSSDLLNPDAPARPKLPIIAQRLAALRPRRNLRVGKFLVAASLLVVLAAAIVAGFSFLDFTARAHLRQTKADWFGKFALSASDTKRQERWRADPDLKRLLAETADVPAVDTDSKQLIRWNYRDYMNVLAASASVQALQDDLAGHWKLAGRAEELRTRLAARGWAQPAEYLGNLLEATRPPRGDVAAGVDRLLQDAPNIEKGLTLADSDWKRFVDRMQMIEAGSDPVLTALAGVLKKAGSSEVHLDATGFSGLDEVKRDADQAEQLAKILSDTFPVNVDRKHFDDEVAKTIDLKHLKKQDVTQWTLLVAKHAFRHDEAAAAAEDLRKRLAAVVDLVIHAHVSPDEVTAFETARHDASNAIGDFEQMKFTRRTIEDKFLESQANQVRNRIEGLRKYYHPEGPEDWLNALASVATASNAINARWEAWRNVLRNDVPQMVANRDFFKERQKASELLRSLLVALDQTFPPAPPIPNQAFMAAARLRREQTLEKLLPQIDLSAPTLPADLKKSADEFSQWTSNLVALSKDFPISKEIIGPNDLIDAPWKLKPQFWLDPAVQALVKTDVERLDRIRVLDNAPRAQLVTEMNTSDQAEVALAAWRLLGSESIRPSWPTGIAELNDEIRLRTRVAGSLDKLKNPAEGEAPQRELAGQGPIRWRRFVENATSEAMVQKAWNFVQAFKVDDAELAKLSPVAHYNLALARLRQAIALDDNNLVRSELKGLSGAAATLKTRPEIASLPARIAKVDAKEPFEDDNPGDVFDLKLPGSDKAVQFKRMERTNGRAFYLCTMDVSVGQFMATLTATQAWPQARQLAWPYEPGKVDTRRGPRTWEWNASAASPMSIPELWMTPEKYNEFPQSMRTSRFNRTALNNSFGGLPSPDHPVQYVSAQVALYYAAVCGCRLPTSAEWETAYAAVEKPLRLEQWNLRDHTWEEQRRFIEEERRKDAQKGQPVPAASIHWPDEGIFIPPGISASSLGRNATSRPGNDGILFFQPIDAPRGNVFHHLVGNVAQFACDAAEAFDETPDRRSPAGIRRFLEQWPNSLFVIGGSALSPPEAAFDKPLPVLRSQDAYSDVGIRLAFSAPARTLVEKVKWAIGDPPYFWPKPVVEAKGR